MKEINPLERLQAFVKRYRTQTEAAKALGISGPYLHDMLKGNRQISATILTQLGLRRVVTISAKAS